MAAILRPVCENGRGQPEAAAYPGPGPRHLVFQVIDPQEAWLGSQDFWGGARPPTVAATELVACIDVERTETGSCGPYTGGGTSKFLPILEYVVRVRLVAAATAEHVASQTFRSDPPRTCPDAIRDDYPRPGDRDYPHGAPPYGAVHDWLEPYVEPG